MFGHCANSVLIEMLKQARADDSYIAAARSFKCDSCTVVQSQSKTHPVSPPSLYTFNFNVSVDVFEITDLQGQRYSVLSLVDQGTNFHQAGIVSLGGPPSSTKCWQKMQSLWIKWAGPPTMVTCDRGLRNRGTFAKSLTANGTYLRQAALESPWQLGKGERQGSILKTLLKKLIIDHQTVGKPAMKEVITVALDCKNNYIRKGGFSPSQWVLGRYPRQPGSFLDDEEAGQLGVLEHQLDGK